MGSWKLKIPGWVARGKCPARTTPGAHSMPKHPSTTRSGTICLSAMPAATRISSGVPKARRRSDLASSRPPTEFVKENSSQSGNDNNQNANSRRSSNGRKFMSNLGDFRVVRREEIAELLRERFGTDRIAWSIQPESDDVTTQATWLAFFNADPGNDTIHVGRPDQRFFDIRGRIRKEGYFQPVLFEEPRIPHPDDGRPRTVGFVRVYVNLRGSVLTRSETTLIGDTLMIHPTSVSKGEPIPSDAMYLGSWVFYTNPQRIEGAVEVELLQREFPDDEPTARKVREIAIMTPDGRTLSVSAKLMAATNA